MRFSPHRAALAAAVALALGTVVIMSRAENASSDTASPGEGLSASTQPINDAPEGLAVATFGSGCFWCTEAVFQELAGVHQVTSGYAGGESADANYSAVSTGRSAHAEAVQVTYDPSVVDYATLLEVFWKTHDPTTPNRQGADVGPQYRSVVFYHNPQQQSLAESYKKKLDASGAFNAPIVTQISPYANFYPAEGYHQNYFSNNPQQPYCRAVIGPKVVKFREVFGDKLKSAQKKSAQQQEPTKQDTKQPADSPQASLEELRQRLSPLQFHVTQEAGTERPFQNEHWDNKLAGDYQCVVCGELLFTSANKYDSGCGWPSFTAPAEEDALVEKTDLSLGMRRTEIRCSHCDAHLGHVFDDGPAEAGGQRYCLNSAAMQFEKDKPQPEDTDGSKEKPPRE